jgi:hypothetical protein
MTGVVKIVRVVLEVIGVFAIIGALFWYWAFYQVSHMGTRCVDSQVETLRAPGGSEVAQKRQRTCGQHWGTEVLLHVPKDNSPDGFMRVVALDRTDPQKVAFEWTGPNDLSVTFPANAEIEEAYGVVFGVTITLHRIP